MAQNFTLLVSRPDAESLHVMLKGDFDGSSAYSLVHLLKNNLKSREKVVIDTNGLRNIHAFGLAVSEKFLAPLQRRQSGIAFTGKFERYFIPD